MAVQGQSRKYTRLRRRAPLISILRLEHWFMWRPAGDFEVSDPGGGIWHPIDPHRGILDESAGENEGTGSPRETDLPRCRSRPQPS